MRELRVSSTPSALSAYGWVSVRAELQAQGGGDKVRKSGGIIKSEDGPATVVGRLLARYVGGNSDDVGIGVGQRFVPARLPTPGLDLGNGRQLIAFHDDEITRVQPGYDL